MLKETGEVILTQAQQAEIRGTIAKYGASKIAKIIGVHERVLLAGICSRPIKAQHWKKVEAFFKAQSEDDGQCEDMPPPQRRS